MRPAKTIPSIEERIAELSRRREQIDRAIDRLEALRETRQVRHDSYNSSRVVAFPEAA